MFMPNGIFTFSHFLKGVCIKCDCMIQIRFNVAYSITAVSSMHMNKYSADIKLIWGMHVCPQLHVMLVCGEPHAQSVVPSI